MYRSDRRTTTTPDAKFYPVLQFCSGTRFMEYLTNTKEPRQFSLQPTMNNKKKIFTIFSSERFIHSSLSLFLLYFSFSLFLTLSLSFFSFSLSLFFFSFISLFLLYPLSFCFTFRSQFVLIGHCSSTSHKYLFKSRQPL